MPTYEYKCQSCGKELTLRKSIAERKIPETLPCPECKEITIKNIMSKTSVVSAHRLSGTTSSQPGGDFKERMQQISKHFAKDKHAKIPTF